MTGASEASQLTSAPSTATDQQRCSEDQTPHRQILGHDSGYNGHLQRWRLGERQIDIAGCEQKSDKQRFKGDPHDLIVFGEGTDFLESQYRFIIGWNRSTDPKQRCRVIVASNPPTTPEGLWVVKSWSPWLDTTHPHPVKPGELRWFTTVAGEDREVDGPGPHMIDGELVHARSRTFIRATLSDNPDLARTNYASVLASLPEELRRAYRDGDFSLRASQCTGTKSTCSCGSFHWRKRLVFGLNANLYLSVKT